MYYYDRLDNGLQIIASRMPEKASLSLGVMVSVGGRYETPKQAGISHLVEHMLFKGTKNRTTKQIKESVEGVGGVLNAYTDEEATCYFVKVLKEHLDVSLKVLSDMVQNPLFDAKELSRERTVVLEEIKMYLDLPSHYVHDLIGTLLWPNQPMGQLLAGDEKTVSGITKKNLVDFVKQNYHPKNFIVSVCGDFVFEEIREKIQKCFPENSARKKSNFKKAFVSQKKPQTLFMHRKTEQTHFAIGFHGFSQQDPKRYKAALLNVILGGNMSSRLFDELREKRGLAYEIKSGLSTYEDTGSFTISAGVETKKTEASLELILKQLEKIKNKPVGKLELKRAKDYMLGQFCMSLEDTLDQMTWIAEKALYGKSVPTQEEIKQHVEKVTVQDIQDVANEIFKNSRLNLALIGPISDKQKNNIKKNFRLK